MFDDIAGSYDLLNDVLSFGLHRSWRRRAAEAVSVERGHWMLDLGCGTGGVGLLLAPRARVVGIDLSHAMLLRARRRSGQRMKLIGANALRLPFPDQTFGAVVSAFVLRNLRDLRGAFEEISRVLAPGGTIALMDITEPRSPAFRWLFDGYLRIVAPAVGSLVGKRDAYRYLARSLGQLPPAPVVRSLLEETGFIDCEARLLSGGAVTLFTARLPGA